MYMILKVSISLPNFMIMSKMFDSHDLARSYLNARTKWSKELYAAIVTERETMSDVARTPECALGGLWLIFLAIGGKSTAFCTKIRR